MPLLLRRSSDAVSVLQSFLRRGRSTRPLRVTVLPATAPPWAAWRAPPASAARTAHHVARPSAPPIAAVTVAVLVLAGALLTVYRRDTKRRLATAFTSDYVSG